MFALKRYVIADHERGLVLKERRVQRMLEPGVYWMFDPLGRIEVKVYDLGKGVFEYAQFDVLAQTRADLVEQYFQVVELGEYEVGLVSYKGVLVDVLAPGSRKVYWRAMSDITVEVIDIRDNYQIAADKVRILSRIRDVALGRKLAGYVVIAEVADENIGLLIVDGQLVKTLAPGLTAYWTFNRSVKVEHVDTRVQVMEVSGQEILTKDKVSLRVNLAASYQIRNAVKARAAYRDMTDHLYRELQFGLRQAIGLRTLDTLLGEKGAMERDVFQYVHDKVAENGIELRNTGIKDVILPGDMKDILNQVVEAEKASQANVIKRREETAATRSLLNTARLMDDNPTLLRLKELEVLEKVTEKVDRLTVFGGLDGVIKDMVKINV